MTYFIYYFLPYMVICMNVVGKDKTKVVINCVFISRLQVEGFQVTLYTLMGVVDTLMTGKVKDYRFLFKILCTSIKNFSLSVLLLISTLKLKLILYIYVLRMCHELSTRTIILLTVLSSVLKGTMFSSKPIFVESSRSVIVFVLTIKGHCTLNVNHCSLKLEFTPLFKVRVYPTFFII